MRIPQIVVIAALLVLPFASCRGADASAGTSERAAAARDATSGPAAPTEEVRALVRQFGRGGGDKDVAGEAFYDLAQRAAPGLLEVVKDPATPAYDLASVVFIANVYVREPEIFQALRMRAPSVRDPEERRELTALIEGLSVAPGLPYPR